MSSKRKPEETKEAGKAKKGKLWGGRFTGATDPVFEAFNASIQFDKKLWSADLRGSMAYAKALAKSGVITDKERDELVEGLEKVSAEWAAGEFKIELDTDEDIHTANERRLGEIVGSVAGKLHTGRSRNDQVATDIRLWCMDEMNVLMKLLLELIGSAVMKAEKDIDVLMPGFTHLQPAQPVRWSHLLLSYASAWQRDAMRLQDLMKRVKVLPLGSGALAGNPFGVDRDFLAKELGFDSVSPNSLDAVCNRDFVAEILFFGSMFMVHTSQWAEDFIIFASKKMVTIADAYSTGSSLMPQKKNPDALELLRGKSGRVFGSLSSLLMMLKSLPRAYNKDLQEDKEGLFDCCKTLRGCIAISTGVMSTVTPNETSMRALLAPEMLATDLAEYLVRKGVPFRETHHIAGAAVKLAEDAKKPFDQLTVKELKTLHKAFDEDVTEVWKMETSVDSRDAPGGTARKSVEEQIKQLTAWLAAAAETPL